MLSNNRYGDIEGGRSRSGRGGAFNDANSNIMEQQNNERIDLLSDQVARLKGLTIDIGSVLVAHLDLSFVIALGL